MENWTINGIRGRGPIPPPADSCKGRRALVLGAGRALWADLAEINGAPLTGPVVGWDILAINYAGLVLPFPFRHWFSVHADVLGLMAQLRRLTYRTEPLAQIHCTEPGAGHHWQLDSAGLSGFAAAQVALALGYDEAVLCGCAEDGSGYFHSPPGFDPRPTNWGAEALWRGADASMFRGRVTSVSGNTALWLGRPAGLRPATANPASAVPVSNVPAPAGRNPAGADPVPSLRDAAGA